MNELKPLHNRAHAGRQLAAALAHYARDPAALMLALPRGGVPVGFAAARQLRLELDILMVRKLGLPGQEEFAMGAIGSGDVRVLRPDILAAFGITDDMLEAVCSRELLELARREELFRGSRPPPVIAGHTIILVDDGLATGSTMRAAIEIVRAGAPGRIVAAAPVGAPETCAALEAHVDELVCPLRPSSLEAVSKWYDDFTQVTDQEVQEVLQLAWGRQGDRAQRSHHLPIH